MIHYASYHHLCAMMMAAASVFQLHICSSHASHLHVTQYISNNWLCMQFLTRIPAAHDSHYKRCWFDSRSAETDGLQGNHCSSHLSHRAGLSTAVYASATVPLPSLFLQDFHVLCIQHPACRRWHSTVLTILTWFTASCTLVNPLSVSA